WISSHAGPFGYLIPYRPRVMPWLRPTLSRGDRRAGCHFSLSRATMRGAAGDFKTHGLWDGSRPPHYSSGCPFVEKTDTNGYRRPWGARVGSFREVLGMRRRWGWRLEVV